jgi:DNA polymerase
MASVPTALPKLPVVSEPLPASPHPVGSRDDREWRLNQWKQRVAACVRCQELASSRHQTVFGVGNPEARFLFIGEAPGADEDAQGEPFVGAAGQLLDKIIVACGLKRADIYICNILRCRPPGNRKPLPIESGNCREFLDAQIAIIDPEFIVCWGATAAQNLMGTDESIGRLRGRVFEHGRAKVLCTYHPSYLLRNPAAKKDVWQDMKFFLKEAGLPVPSA